MKFNTRSMILALVALLLLPAMLLAQESKMDKLRERFKQRYPEVQKLKQAGVIGETSDGYLDYVKKKDAKAAEVVNAENADRKELYQAIADKEHTTPELVAVRNAKRNFERAKPGEYLKQDGKWKQKES